MTQTGQTASALEGGHQRKGSDKTWDQKSRVPETALIRYRSLRGLSIVFLLMAVMLHTIDSTIANVALPHMQGALSANIDQISWIITAYIMASAIATPAVAWLSDRFGLKRVLIVSTLGFTAASALCGLAVSLNDMVFYRILQGLSGAALIPLGQTVLLSTFEREEYPRAMSLFGFGVMFGPIIGPTLGGYITEFANWRWVFFVNVPIGIIAAIGIALLVKERAINKNAYFDSFGFAAMVLAIACFQMVLDRGHGADWFQSWEIITLFLLALTGLYLYVLRTVTSDRPLFDREIYLNRNFVFGNLAFFIIMGNLITTSILLPTLMQSVMGYPVIKAGLLTVPRGLGMMIAMVLIPRVTEKLDQRFISLVGLLIIGVALVDQARINIYFTEWDFVRAGFWQGFGLGVVFVQMGSLCFSTIPDRLRLQATTVYNISRNIGSAFFASLAITWLARDIQINTAEIGENVNTFAKSLDTSTLAVSSLAENPTMLALFEGEISRQAALVSYINIFTLVALVTIVAAPFVMAIRPPAPGDVFD